MRTPLYHPAHLDPTYSGLLEFHPGQPRVNAGASTHSAPPRMSSWALGPHLILGLPDPRPPPPTILFCAPGRSLWDYRNFIQGPHTLARGQDAPRPKTVQLSPFSPPSLGLSARWSLHWKTGFLPTVGPRNYNSLGTGSAVPFWPRMNGSPGEGRQG